MEAEALSDRIAILQGDLRNYKALFRPASFTLITCNPPYKKANSGITNEKYEIYEYLREDLRMGCPDTQDLKEVADVLWANTKNIDEYIEYLKERNMAADNDICILESWRHPVSGRFVLERHLAKGSIFLDTKSVNVYLVK